MVEKAFEARFGLPAAFVARAPGRVNCIGEHIDYAGFSVCPFALTQAVTVACTKLPPSSSSSSSLIVAANADPATHADGTLPFELSALQQMPSPEGWLAYVRAGVLASLELAAARGVAAESGGCGGVALFFDGAVPQGSGLSSSSALVVASALAVLHVAWNAADRASLSKEDFAAACARAERYVGTAGGGMDQAISVGAVAGSASLVEFVPRLRMTPVALPAAACFVVANSCVVSAKAVTAADRFNKRVAETRLAAVALAARMGMPVDGISVLRDVADRAVGLTLRNLAAKADELLHPGAYSLAEVAALVGMPVEQVRERCVTRPVNGDAFLLHDRALHVFSEAARVLEFARPGNSIAALGMLMAQSHASCRDLYQCSCAELDEIVVISTTAGASGARLTGAGWGGCAVALCDGEEAASKVVSHLDAEFFVAKCGMKPGEAQSRGFLFITTPAAGASVSLL